MCDLFGIDRSMLADLRPSAGVFGHVAADVVPELAGLAITGVLGDQQSALFGQACFTPGLVKATYGTGAFVLASAGDSVPPVVNGLLTTVAWDLGSSGAVNYALEGSAFVAGAAAQWLRDLGLIAHSSDLEGLARSVADSAGAIFVPAFTGLGSPFWRPEARGALMGLSRGVTSAHVARAIVEALAFQVRAMTDAFRGGGVEVRQLRADGGAAAMDLLLSLQATNSRVSVQRSTTLEATARGAAGIAGLAVGRWGSLDELGDLWSSAATFAPEDPIVVDAGYAAWSRAVERVQ
jgi:glycerol kinase